MIESRAKNSKHKLFLILGLTLSGLCFAQNDGGSSFSGVVPEVLKRPARETEWIYPADAVIGQLGEGEASAAANAYARTVLRNLLRRNEEAPSLKDVDPGQLGDVMTKLGETDPRKVRMGGGRDETDGSVSFLFRFIGRENDLSGELYIRDEDGNWKTEDIIVNGVQKISRESDAFAAVYTPYERFY
ncbi:MAG: hypothetical protein LBH50_02410 [Spirochaetaceae bacterium]|jgi:hypothetical protein|nr:hypothetical protein [Spirochaetaceae bacterium]